MASKLEWSISEVFIKVLEVEAATKLNDHENHMLFVMKCKKCQRLAVDLCSEKLIPRPGSLAQVFIIVVLLILGIRPPLVLRDS